MILNNKNRTGLRPNVAGYTGNFVNKSIFLKDPNVPLFQTNTKWSFHISYSRNNSNTWAVTGLDRVYLWRTLNKNNPNKAELSIRLQHQSSLPKILVFNLKCNLGEYTESLTIPDTVKEITHYTVTFDGTLSSNNLKHYFNGILFKISSFNPATYGLFKWNVNSNNNNSAIWGGFEGENVWDLVLYEQQIYDDVLTNTEIKYLVNNNNIPTTGIQNKMVSWYDYTKKSVSNQYVETPIETSIPLNTAVIINNTEFREITNKTGAIPSLQYTYAGVTDLTVTSVRLLYSVNLLEWDLLEAGSTQFSLSVDLPIGSFVLLNGDQLRRITNKSGSGPYIYTYDGTDLNVSSGNYMSFNPVSFTVVVPNTFRANFPIFYDPGKLVLLNGTELRTIVSRTTISPGVYDFEYSGALVSPLNEVYGIDEAPLSLTGITDDGTNLFTATYQSNNTFFSYDRLDNAELLFNNLTYRTTEYNGDSPVWYTNITGVAGNITSVKVNLNVIKNKLGAGEIWLNKIPSVSTNGSTISSKFCLYKGGAWVDKDYNIAE